MSSEVVDEAGGGAFCDGVVSVWFEGDIFARRIEDVSIFRRAACVNIPDFVLRCQLQELRLQRHVCLVDPRYVFLRKIAAIGNHIEDGSRPHLLYHGPRAGKQVTRDVARNESPEGVLRLGEICMKRSENIIPFRPKTFD